MMVRACRSLAVLLIVLSIGGCSRQPAPETALGLPPATGLYVDWDDLDWNLDRYLQVNIRDYATSQNLSRLRPLADYRAAVTYDAEWDSVGLDLYVRLNDSEQADRQRLARRHHAEARRIMLGIIHQYASMLERGYLPNLSTDLAARPAGVETAVTTTIALLVKATGLDPSLPGAWRDLGYFCGVVGDQRRQLRALSAALAALDRLDPFVAPGGDADRLRRDIFLDLAWLARDQGQPNLTLAYLDHLEPWLLVDGPERDQRRFEADLLRGLALADRGDTRLAIQVAGNLPEVRLAVRALRGGVREDLRWNLSAPNRDRLGFQRSAWPRQASDFGRQWIRAIVGAPSGDPAHTVWRLGPPPTALELPPRLAWRYWQDRGRVHQLAGDHHDALRSFEWAAMYRPFMAFFPVRGAEGPSRLGTADGTSVFYTGYGAFFLCGDRGAYLGSLPGAFASGSGSL